MDGKRDGIEKIFLCLLALVFISIFPAIGRAETAAVRAPQIRVLFSPRDNCAQEIIGEINQARGYVDAAMYFFTSRPIAQALVSAKDRGVDVRVCLDEEQPRYEHSKSRFLEKAGINLKLISGSGIMHNKFCVIDDSTVITGSYNWTTSADLENDENVLIIKSAETAKIYKEQFNRYWNGTYVDSCVYKDKNRLEKVPLAIGAAQPIITPVASVGRYLGHKNTKKFHQPDCPWAKKISAENQVWLDSREEAVKNGYVPCKVCNP